MSKYVPDAIYGTLKISLFSPVSVMEILIGNKRKLYFTVRFLICKIYRKHL